MAGDALVVDGGQLAPRVEPLDAHRDAPPHPTGAGKVLAGRRVVDAALLGRGDAALERPQGLGDVEVDAGEGIDGGVTGLLHPGLQGIGAVQRARRVGLQCGDRLAHPTAGHDLRCHLLLLLDHEAQVLQAPRVRLVEVDRGADEPTGREGVALPSDRVGGPGTRRELLAEEGGELAVGGSSDARRRRPDAREVPVVAGQPVDLGGHGLDLAQGRGVRGGDAGPQGLLVPGQGGGDVAQSPFDGRAVVVGVVAHEVQHVADALGGGGDDVQVAAPRAVVVLLHRQLEGADQLRAGDRILGPDRLGRTHTGQRLPGGIGRCGVAVGGVVGVLALTSGPTELDVHLGVQLQQGLQPAVGDPVEGSGCVSHGTSVGGGTV
ncbi:hypothetical protein GCM10009821_13790 [Aeromicrobium halocynthiae]|uniref:Uncharacterized protein n=1 Tax=Aeromicrobium halocynthiae TaxID=560557 RepID=A0ABN2VX36_9ACTN